MRVVAIANQKGGCGKTTTAVNLSACLGIQNKRVLLVDLDPQSHASIALNDPQGFEGSGVAAVLKGGLRLEDAIHPVAKGVDMLCSSTELDDLETEMVADPGRRERLRTILREAARNYDITIIDCPPNTGPMTRAALAAAYFLLLPVETSYFALYGVGRMLRLHKEEEARRGAELPYGILMTLFDRRTAHAREVLKQLGGHFGQNLFSTVVAVNVSLREAASHGRPITEYRPRSRGFQHHMQLSKELIAVLADKEHRPTALASGGE